MDCMIVNTSIILNNSQSIMNKGSIYNKTLRNAPDIYMGHVLFLCGSEHRGTWGLWGYIRLDLRHACFEDWKPLFQYLEMGWTLFELF